MELQKLFKWWKKKKSYVWTCCPCWTHKQYHTIQLFSTSKSLFWFVMRLGKLGAWWPERQMKINITYLHCYQLYNLILPPSSPVSFYRCLILYCGNSLPDPPNNTSISDPGPVNEGSTATLTCNTNANPAVDSYTWYKVDGDEVTAVGSKKKLSTTVSEVDNKFYCQVSNTHGAQNSSITQIDVHCKLDHNRNKSDK